MSPITAKLTTHCIPSTYKSHARLLFAPIQRLVLHDLVTRRFFVSVSIAGHSWTVQTLQRWSTPYTNPGPGHELGDAPFGQACRCSASAWRTRCLCVDAESWRKNAAGLCFCDTKSRSRFAVNRGRILSSGHRAPRPACVLAEQTNVPTLANHVETQKTWTSGCIAGVCAAVRQSGTFTERVQVVCQS